MSIESKLESLRQAQESLKQIEKSADSLPDEKVAADTATADQIHAEQTVDSVQGQVQAMASEIFNDVLQEASSNPEALVQNAEAMNTAFDAAPDADWSEQIGKMHETLYADFTSGKVEALHRIDFLLGPKLGGTKFGELFMREGMQYEASEGADEDKKNYNQACQVKLAGMLRRLGDAGKHEASGLLVKITSDADASDWNKSSAFYESSFMYPDQAKSMLQSSAALARKAGNIPNALQCENRLAVTKWGFDKDDPKQLIEGYEGSEETFRGIADESASLAAASGSSKYEVDRARGTQVNAVDKIIIIAHQAGDAEKVRSLIAELEPNPQYSGRPKEKHAGWLAELGQKN